MEGKDAVREYVMREIVQAERKGISLSDDDSIIKSGLINSIAVVDMINFLENKFGLNIADGEIQIDDFDSVNSIWCMLERKATRV